MFLTFHVPPLASGQELGEINKVKLEVTQKSLKNEKSWNDGIKPFLLKWENSNYRSNFAVAGLSFFFNLSGVLPTILYRYHIIPARWLVEAHEMSKSLNLPY